MFFASVTDFLNSLDFKEEINEVRIWDDSAAGAVNKVVLKFAQNGEEAAVT
ncbi:hypothetical protein [Peribacillus sp. SCS-37]|uniref:hypothetical protein n=1 Tax=Paraperibacillus esterisolvens TaxID=3115296 RepID=UPI003906C008